MPALTLSEAGRRKFAGNVTMYEEIYKYRQRIFLVRNVNAVLDASKGVGELRNMPSRNSTNGGSSRFTSSTTPQRKRKTIAQIYNQLQPAKPTPGGPAESRLRIVVNSLSRSTQPTPRHAPISSITGTSIRCRVKLTIWYLKNGTPAEPTSNEQLLCESETCTLNFEHENSASIEMDDWFIIKHGKLCVLLDREFRIANGYRYELYLSPVENLTAWPPFGSWPPSMGKNSNFAETDPLKVEVVVRIDSGSQTPNLNEYKAYFRIPGRSRLLPANLSMGIEFGWYHPDHLKFTQLPVVAAPRPSTPPPPYTGRKVSQKALTVITYYTFLAPVENSSSWYGPPDPKGHQAFFSHGYACIFCDGLQFPDTSYLHFHLLTAHELLSYKVKSSSKPMTGLRSAKQSHDRYVEIVVDLAREFVHNRPSNDVPDHRDFCWVRPSKPLDYHKILKGDWSWLNQKKTLTAGGLRRDFGSDDPAFVLSAERKIDWNNIPTIPKKQTPKFVVKKPRTKEPKGTRIYVRSQSKRYVDVGEVLSESDNEVDEEWLVRKHEETICDFEDIAKNEHEFMKLWDRHMFEERIIAYSHVGPSLYRFAQKHKELLREGPLLIEFWKHCLNQVQFRTIDTEALRAVMEVVKGGKEEWSSVGKSKWGLALNGPFILDDEKDRNQTPSPTAARKGRSSKMVQNEGPSVKKEPVEETAKNDDVSFGLCKWECNKPWERSDMVRCCGKTCEVKWFHRSCFEGIGRWAQNWLCPNCKAA